MLRNEVDSPSIHQEVEQRVLAFMSWRDRAAISVWNRPYAAIHLFFACWHPHFVERILQTTIRQAAALGTVALLRMVETNLWLSLL